jgi:predicted Zn-dependent protease
LSLRGEFLDKAEKMSKKIVDAEPENSTYLDTYGWVLYKQNKLQEAKEILNKSIKLGGDKSAVIIEHLGDILFKLGETEEAIKQWKKAKETGKGTDLLDKKIKENKLIE